MSVRCLQPSRKSMENLVVLSSTPLQRSRNGSLEFFRASASRPKPQFVITSRVSRSYSLQGCIKIPLILACSELWPIALFACMFCISFSPHHDRITEICKAGIQFIIVFFLLVLLLFQNHKGLWSGSQSAVRFKNLYSKAQCKTFKHQNHCYKMNCPQELVNRPIHEISARISDIFIRFWFTTS